MDIVKRRVELVVAGDRRTPTEISDLLGIQPDRQIWKGETPEDSTLGRPARENSWELREAGDGSVDVSQLLARLFHRIHPAREGLESLRKDGLRIIVSVILYISNDDSVGSGFVLTDAFIAVLAKIGATFEVDQYVDS